MFDGAPLMMGFTGPDGMPEYVNRAWEQTLGWTLEETQQPDSGFLAGLFPDFEARRQFLDFMARSDGTWQDFRTRVRDGRVLDTTWAFIRLSGGNSMGMGQDVSQRTRTGGQPGASFKEIGDVMASLDEHAIVAVTDVEGKITYVNDKFCGISKYSRAELLGQVHRLINSRHHPPEFIRGLWTTITQGQVWHGEIRNKAKDGSFYWVGTAIIPLLNAEGGPRQYVAISADITERKLVEAESLRCQEQLRALTARLESLREDERIRISREIHDELGQNLTALKMDLLWTERRLELEESSPLSISILERVVGMTEIVDGTIASVQEIAAKLRPGVLDKLGLGAAIHYEARRFSERTGITCHLQLPEEEPVLPSGIATALFRIFQECLTNIVRHANAADIRVELKADADGTTLTVTDDGRGITEGEMNSHHSLGLMGMRERAAMFGGEIIIERAPQNGTVVVARFLAAAELRKEDVS